jgi:hypothetical protein
MRMLDRLIRTIKSKGDVWIATPEEIAEYYLENPDP